MRYVLHPITLLFIVLGVLLFYLEGIEGLILLAISFGLALLIVMYVGYYNDRF